MAVTMNEEQRRIWQEIREHILSRFLEMVDGEADKIDCNETVVYFVRTGITRAFDQRYSRAEDKLALIESLGQGNKITLDSLVPKGSEKSRLVSEIAKKQTVLTTEMLKKLSVDQLRDLLDKF